MIHNAELSNNDHKFAQYLRKEKAIDNFASVDKGTTWYRPDGTIAAFAIYNNAESTYNVYLPAKP